ncbi:MAG: hypothetical protein WC474_06590 [Hydrogenophilaceae bacterium]
MKPATADFMIHVNEPLSEPEMARVADSVCGDTCVTSACVSQDNPHLILVNYDSDCSSARDILRKVTGLGLHAQAVGM